MEGAAASGVCQDDVVKLCEVLKGTFSGSQEERKNSESHLQKIGCTPGLLAILLSIVRHTSIEVDVRLAAAIYLKNEIRRHWMSSPYSILPISNVDSESLSCSDGQKAALYSEADKEYLRQNLFGTLVDVADTISIRNMIDECIRYVALYDFPEKWPSILKVITTNLQNYESAHEVRVFCALVALRRLTAKYELDMKSDRQHLYTIIDQCFPLVLKLASALSTARWTHSPSKSIMMKLICAIYWGSTQIALAKGGVVESTLDHWMALMEHILKEKVPQDVFKAAGEDEEERARLEQVKAKKRAAQIVHRFFSRYATDKDQYKEFGKMFLDRWAVRFLDCQLEMLSNSQTDEECWISPRVRSLILQYLSQAVEISKTYKHMKMQCETILRHFCFPLLCYSDSDEEKWDFDAAEFVRLQNDNEFISFADPREAAVEFIQTLTRLRSKDFLGIIQTMVTEVLNEYGAGPPSVSLCRRKDGALCLLGNIANRLASEKRKMPVAPFLLKHVVPELESSNKFLRLRACWTVERFLLPVGNFQFGGRRNCPFPKFESNEQPIQIFQIMLARCRDSELPVRVQAGSSLKAFFALAVEGELDTLKKHICSQLPEIMRSVFSLMSEIDNEYVVTTLQMLVEYFEDEVFPYSVQLIESLSRALMEFLESDEENEEQLGTALSISDTILTILSSSGFASLKDAAAQQAVVAIENTLLPLLDRMLHPDHPDQLDDGIRMTAYLTTYTPAISPNLWLVFERFHAAMCGGSPLTVSLPEIFRNGWAPDYLNQMLPCLHNFIVRDPSTFLCGKSAAERPYSEMVMEMARKGIDDNGDPDGPKHGLELLSYIFTAFLGKPGPVDALMKPSFEIQWQYMKVATMTKSIRGVLIRVWCTMILYNTRFFLTMLEEANVTEEFFLLIFRNVGDLKSVDGKKILILAMCALLEFCSSSPSLTPPVISSHIVQIGRMMADNQSQLIELRQKLEEETEENDSDPDTDSEESLGEDDDAPQKTHDILAKLRDAAAANDDEDEDDEDDDSYETESSMSCLLARSRLDDLEESVVFAQLLAKTPQVFLESLGETALTNLKMVLEKEIRCQEERRNVEKEEK